jgi:hypothetical protein
MHPEERFHQTQKRAYEIYRQREPNSGTPEEDWRKAETETEEVEQFRPTRVESSLPKDRMRWDELENPT